MKLNARLSCGHLIYILLSPNQWFDVYWPAARKGCFSLLFIGVISAKLLRIYSHLTSLSFDRFALWGPTFFVEDVFCVLLAHTLCRDFRSRWTRVICFFLMFPASIIVSGLAAANIAFYSQTGSEIHWHQAHWFHRDAAAVKTLLTGLAGVAIGEMLFSAAAYFLTPYLYNIVQTGISIFQDAFAPFCKCCISRKPLAEGNSYEQVAIEDWRDDHNDEEEAMLGTRKQDTPARRLFSSLLVRIIVLSVASYTLLLRIIRPHDTAYSFLSQTVAMTPFIKPPPRSLSVSFDLPDMPGNYSWLYNHTAIGPTKKLDWLPSQELPGFRDWYRAVNVSVPQHYDPDLDPLHVSNLDRDIIEPLRVALSGGDVKIKHVFLLKLESTRADVFPLKKDSYLTDVIKNSFSGHIPDEVEERLANLTRNAQTLTGVPSGFEEPNFTPRGGIYASNTHTGGTFTLKSIVASVCGSNPLVVDFNREYLHHIYQPCIPHVLSALNSMHRELPHNDTKSTDSPDFRNWPWRSSMMMSITDDYDNQNLLTPVLGFDDKVTDETITEDSKKKPGPAPKKYNFWGYEEHELRDYFLDALREAEKKHERLFVTHLTGQTHHPWIMPVGEPYEELISGGLFNMNHKINRYLNTIGVSDKWLGEVMDILDEAGVADETLVVMVGDHGLSLVEDGSVTPNDGPHVANFAVPLVFSHPKLPPIQIDGRVTSTQILPTILDMLVATQSLDEPSADAIQSLLPIYEGQSMIRELVPEKNGRLTWQFTVMNTGGTWLSCRCASKPYRLVIPLLPDVEWRFTDTDLDPHEETPLKHFNLPPLMKEVERVHGEEAAQWVNDAAHVAQWWVGENWRRYEYTPEN